MSEGFDGFDNPDPIYPWDGRRPSRDRRRKDAEPWRWQDILVLLVMWPFLLLGIPGTLVALFVLVAILDPSQG